MKIQDLFEQPKKKIKTQTQTKRKLDNLSNIDTAPNLGSLSTTFKKSDIDTPSNLTRKKVPGKIAPRDRTKSSIKPPNSSAAGQMADYISRIKTLYPDNNDEDNDTIDNDTGVTTPDIKTTTLPAIISKELSTQGFEPEWHQVKNLPGYAVTAIKTFGRQVFKPFTDTPIEDIYVISTLSNPDDHVKAIATWIKQNGVKNDHAEAKAEDILPGYSGEILMYDVEDFTFMIVKDNFGYYIYGWPASNRLTATNKIPKKLS